MGGAQMFIMNIYRNIDKSKVQFDFILNEKGVFDDEIRKLGGNIYYMPYITDIGQHQYGKKLKEFFNNNGQYKIVHSHINQVSGYILKIAKESGIKTRIAHSHSTNNLNNIIVKMYKNYLQSMINNYANGYFACSEEAAKWLFRKKWKEATIIKNGIDINKFKYCEEKRRDIRKQHNIDGKIKVYGHVGRFSKVKNQQFIVELFKEISKIEKDSKLLLVGAGEKVEEIRQYVKSNNLEMRVIFAGEKMNIDEYYNAMDVFIFPSLYEGIPLTLIEAQTNGLPILASETIDNNVKITDRIQFLPLEANKQVWVNKLVEINTNRIETSDLIRNAGYDILNNAKFMEEFYLKNM